MHVFALTGGIGSGKSTVAQHWRRRGLPVVDADQLARQAVAPGTPALAAIVARFGKGVLLPGDRLDRQTLGQLVFQDAEARQQLNAVVHPAIQSLARAEFTALRNAGYPLACYEIPLLFETGQQDNYRPVVLVTVPEAIQLALVSQRDQSSTEAVRARLASQLPLAEKVPLADYVIDNSGSEAVTTAAADSVLQSIRAKLGLAPASPD